MRDREGARRRGYPRSPACGRAVVFHREDCCCGSLKKHGAAPG
ncbi:hypothetical protein [Ornithinimicrobium kibberense]